jgi:hypothetical protein
MSAKAMSGLFDSVSSPAIMKHLKEHTDGDGSTRNIEVEPELPARERVLALQKMQLDEVERRIKLAKQRADELNASIDKLREMGAEGADDMPYHDWSEFFDILGKDGQSAIGSILKVTALEDRKAAKTTDLKIGLFEAMAKAGLAPRVLVGGPEKLALPAPIENDNDDVLAEALYPDDIGAK